LISRSAEDGTFASKEALGIVLALLLILTYKSISNIIKTYPLGVDKYRNFMRRVSNE